MVRAGNPRILRRPLYGDTHMAYLFLHDGIDHYPMRRSNVPVPSETKSGSIVSSRVKRRIPSHQSRSPASQHPRCFTGSAEDGRGIHRASRTGARLSCTACMKKWRRTEATSSSCPIRAWMDYLGAMSFNLDMFWRGKALLHPRSDRAKFVRIIATELNRICSHLLWVGAYLATWAPLPPFCSFSMTGNRSWMSWKGSRDRG